MMSNILEMWSEASTAYANTAKFYAELWSVYAGAFLATFEVISKSGGQSVDDIQKNVKGKLRDYFDSKFKEETFVKALSDYVEDSSYLARISGLGDLYRFTSHLFAVWNNSFVEPIRDAVGRTPAEKIYVDGKLSLLHHNVDSSEEKPPLFVIYAFINRHYILDLLPQISVVRNFEDHGFDIFSSDIGTPDYYDSEITVDCYVNRYIDKCIDIIRERKRVDKVSVLGYCWGGNIAMIYAALHPEKVKNVITLATPGNLDLDNETLSTWTKNLNPDPVVNAFGNVPGIMLNAGFVLRDPVTYASKYLDFFSQPREPKTVSEFLATEMWLYDSPPVRGEMYRTFVKELYQKNSLIKNNLQLDGKSVDLRRITMPFLNIMAEKDDLVVPDSSKALSEAIGSKDKDIIEFPSGHVGLIIGEDAHRELWPKVAEWLKKRV